MKLKLIFAMFFALGVSGSSMALACGKSSPVGRFSSTNDSSAPTTTAQAAGHKVQKSAK